MDLCRPPKDLLWDYGLVPSSKSSAMGLWICATLQKLCYRIMVLCHPPKALQKPKLFFINFKVVFDEFLQFRACLTIPRYVLCYYPTSALTVYGPWAPEEALRVSQIPWAEG